MNDDYYYKHNDNVNKRKKINNKGYIKKKDKHWKNNGKRNNKRENIEDIMNDDEILRIQNLIRCKKCENIYHSSLKSCSYCNPNL